jgi:MFS family permease
MSAGMLILGLAVLLYTRIPVNGHYWPDLLPSYLIFALGMAFAFIPVSIAALAGVEAHQAGLASGLLNTNQQIGGAVGVAVVTTIFTSATSGKHPHSKTEALELLTKGFQHGFWALVALSVAGAIAGFVLLRGVKAEDVTEHEAAGVAI